MACHAMLLECLEDLRLKQEPLGLELSAAARRELLRQHCIAGFGLFMRLFHPLKGVCL